MNFAAGRPDAEHDPGLALDEIEKAVRDAGYGVERAQEVERPLSPVHVSSEGEGASTTLLYGATFDGLFSTDEPLHVHIMDEEGTPNLACADLSETQKAAWTGP